MVFPFDPYFGVLIELILVLFCIFKLMATPSLKDHKAGHNTIFKLIVIQIRVDLARRGSLSHVAHQLYLLT